MTMIIDRASVCLLAALPGAFVLSGCSSGPIFGTPPGGPYDIEVTSLEVTQGIQNLDNQMPLVADRKTVVRVHARELEGRNVPGVRAMVKVSVGAATTDGGAAGYGYNALSDRITVTPGGSDRLDPTTTFDVPITLPMPSPEAPATLADGPAQVRISATVNEDRLGEEAAANNEIVVDDLELHRADPLKIHFVPVHLPYAGARRADAGRPQCTGLRAHVPGQWPERHLHRRDRPAPPPDRAGAGRLYH
jgi:hypothetical protein